MSRAKFTVVMGKGFHGQAHWETLGYTKFFPAGLSRAFNTLLHVAILRDVCPSMQHISNLVLDQGIPLSILGSFLWDNRPF